MSIADPNKTILTGENPFIRLSLKDGDPNSTDASYWRIVFSPAGPGHVLYLKSELTEGRWRIYSDNIAMARWLQTTVQGMLNAELSDTTISCAEATFSKTGDPRYFWTEYIKSHSEDISLTWFDIGEPLLIHSQPNQIPNRRYGVCTVLIPALGTRLVRNGIEAKGQILAARARGAAVLDIGVGILGKLDGRALRRNGKEWQTSAIGGGKPTLQLKNGISVYDPISTV